jgi:hypothetical protein
MFFLQFVQQIRQDFNSPHGLQPTPNALVHFLTVFSLIVIKLRDVYFLQLFLHFLNNGPEDGQAATLRRMVVFTPQPSSGTYRHFLLDHRAENL